MKNGKWKRFLDFVPIPLFTRFSPLSSTFVTDVDVAQIKKLIL